MDKQYNILYVDDDEQNLFLFRASFSNRYNVITTTSPQEALDILEKKLIHVLFADQRMPEINGIQLLEKAKVISPDSVRIIITGYSDIDVAIDAINRGAVFRYVSKPWDPEDIETSIKNALEFYDLKKQNSKLLTELNDQNELLKKKVQELNFLNELNLQLRKITEEDSIIDFVIKELSSKFKAKEGIYIKFSKHRNTMQTEGLSIDKNLLQDKDFSVVTKKNEKGNLEYILVLPLWFQESYYGALNFKFNEKIDMIDAPIFKAISYVIASALHNYEINRATIERERIFIIGQMSSMLVHDLKNPINTILGFISILEKKIKNSEDTEYLHFLKEEVNRLFSIVNELLDFAKGKQHLEITEIEIRELLEEILNNYSIKFEKNNINLEIDIDDCSTMYADRGKMRRVIINLIDNAVEKLMSATLDRTIRISCINLNNNTIIEIANSGPQIPDFIADKIFDPFFSEGKNNGTGLGLTICKKIVEEHSGKITLNYKNSMTTFTICLPNQNPQSVIDS